MLVMREENHLGPIGEIRQDAKRGSGAVVVKLDQGIKGVRYYFWVFLWA
jgi:hypothetical protein